MRSWRDSRRRTEDRRSSVGWESLRSCMARGLRVQASAGSTLVVQVELLPDGRPQILVSSTEFGQGTNTILCQVAAQTLQVPYEQVVIAQPDTQRSSELRPNCCQPHRDDRREACGAGHYTTTGDVTRREWLADESHARTVHEGGDSVSRRAWVVAVLCSL